MARALALLVYLLRLSAGEITGFGGDWSALESKDGLGLDVQAREPMRQLANGEISCVVVRNVLSKVQASDALARLAQRELLVRGRHGSECANAANVEVSRVISLAHRYRNRARGCCIRAPPIITEMWRREQAGGPHRSQCHARRWSKGQRCLCGAILRCSLHRGAHR